VGITAGASTPDALVDEVEASVTGFDVRAQEPG
jgi:4-hydroxy-3-methylbut-2-enyl diphosphate reductase IspH